MNSPTPLNQRYESFDLLRGIAVCGLVPINIIEFSSGYLVLIYPAGIEQPAGIGLWLTVMTLGLGKFVTLFSMLFGAGLILSTNRTAASGRSEAAAYLPRLAWLCVFGILHSYLIWHGDILVAYAVIGFVLFWCRRWSATVCLIVGGLIWLSVVIGYVLAALVLHIPDLFEAAELEKIWKVILAEEAKETEVLLGSWWEQMRVRALYAFATQLFGIPFYLFWYSGSLMLMGMAMMKTGFFTGGWSRKKLKAATILSVVCGIPLSGIGFSMVAFGGWSPVLFWGFSLAYLVMPLLAFGYAGMGVMWASRSRPGIVRRAFVAAGRMAFTNYIAQSLILSLIFYGHGLGLREQLGFVEVMAIVPAVWIVQLVVSSLWMKRFAYGPIEWLWRRLSYGGSVPFRRFRVPPPIS